MARSSPKISECTKCQESNAAYWCHLELVLWPPAYLLSSKKAYLCSFCNTLRSFGCNFVGLPGRGAFLQRAFVVHQLITLATGICRTSVILISTYLTMKQAMIMPFSNSKSSHFSYSLFHEQMVWMLPKCRFYIYPTTCLMPVGSCPHSVSANGT